MSEDYERILMVKQQVFVYRIPPLGSNRGYKAADWKLDNPDWTGRLKVISRGKLVEIRLEDKLGELFAKAPIEKYPGVDIESVSDSSRYFVIRLKDDSGRSAFIGIGFADRSDSFDLNVTLQDHFKDLEKETKWKAEVVTDAQTPRLDLGFKEGQTIKINIGGVKSEGTARPRASPSNSLGGFVPLLPPPPASGAKIAPPPSTQSRSSSSVTNQFRDDKFVPSLLGGYSEGSAAPAAPHNPFMTSAQKNPFMLETTASGPSRVPPASATTVAVDNLLDL